MSEPDQLDQLDYYTLLGLEPQATPDDVRAAFHRFAMKYHPDRHAASSERKLQRATQIYRRGAEAYRILLDDELRREYDQGLSSGQLRHGSIGEPVVDEVAVAAAPQNESLLPPEPEELPAGPTLAAEDQDEEELPKASEPEPLKRVGR